MEWVKNDKNRILTLPKSQCMIAKIITKDFKLCV